MMKIGFGILIGATCAYLYMNPGDVQGAMEMIQYGIHKGASYIAEVTL